MAQDRYTRLVLPEGRRLEVTAHTVTSLYPVHRHSYFEIELILSGKGVCRINDTAYPIPAYSLFLLTPTDVHSLEADEEISLLNLSFDEEMAEEEDAITLLSSDLPRAYTPSPAAGERLLSVARLLAHECAAEGDCRRMLLSYFVKLLLRESGDRRPPPTEPHDRIAGIRRAYVYLAMHFKEPITLPMLAAEAGYHPTYFCELFRRVTGESYRETLTRLRLGYARSLLANGFSVTDAALLSGFGSLSSFGAAFRKAYGVSPAAYKRTTAK